MPGLSSCPAGKRRTGPLFPRFVQANVGIIFRLNGSLSLKNARRPKHDGHAGRLSPSLQWEKGCTGRREAAGFSPSTGKAFSRKPKRFSGRHAVQLPVSRNPFPMWGIGAAMQAESIKITPTGKDGRRPKWPGRLAGFLTKRPQERQKILSCPTPLFPSVNCVSPALKEIKNQAFSPVMNAVCCFFVADS